MQDSYLTYKPRYSTGNIALDAKLAGGIPVESLVVVYGSDASRTAYAMQGALTAQGVDCVALSRWPRAADAIAQDLYHDAMQNRKVYILAVNTLSGYCPPKAAATATTTLQVDHEGRITVGKFRRYGVCPRRAMLRRTLRYVPDFPVPGINFCDITPVLSDREAMRVATQLPVEAARDFGPVTKVFGAEARGFLFGTPLALALKAGFVPARKPGKLPGATVSQEYGLEYGKDEIHVHEDAFGPGDRVLVVDDILATGGTAEAMCKLVKRLGGEVVGALFFYEVAGLGGEDRLPCLVGSIIKEI